MKHYTSISKTDEDQTGLFCNQDNIVNIIKIATESSINVVVNNEDNLYFVGFDGNLRYVYVELNNKTYKLYYRYGKSGGTMQGSISLIKTDLGYDLVTDLSEMKKVFDFKTESKLIEEIKTYLETGTAPPSYKPSDEKLSLNKELYTGCIRNLWISAMMLPTLLLFIILAMPDSGLEDGFLMTLIVIIGLAILMGNSLKKKFIREGIL